MRELSTLRKAIPNTVTARVIPSNVFAVSAVQLIDNGSGPAIRTGDQITQDNTLPTVVFQTTISKLRDVLFATGRGREDRTIGVLEAVQVATQNRRPKLLTSGAQLDRLLSELDGIDTELTRLARESTALREHRDALLRLHMRTELNRLHRKLDKTFVFVTHDQHEALSMADNLAVFNEGKIAQIGDGMEPPMLDRGFRRLERPFVFVRDMHPPGARLQRRNHVGFQRIAHHHRPLRPSGEPRLRQRRPPPATGC